MDVVLQRVFEDVLVFAPEVDVRTCKVDLTVIATVYDDEVVVLG